VTKRRAKAPVLTPHGFDLAYGKDSAAQPGMVMFRIANEGVIKWELNMPPEEFLVLAHAFENVARAVAADV
jgi:hypothetical protein